MKIAGQISVFILLLFISGCGAGATGDKNINTIIQEPNTQDAKPKQTPQESNPIPKINRSEIKERVNAIDLNQNSFGTTDNLSLERGLIEIIYVGDRYEKDQLFLKDKNGKILNKTFSFEGNVDSTKEGEYIQSYFIDIDGVKSGFKKHIFVVKNTAPKIELIGDKRIEVELGESVTIPFAKAYDREEFKTINKKITLSGDVDLYREGEYELTYSVTDAKGLTDSVKRVVVVKAKDDMNISSVESKLDSYKLLDYISLKSKHPVKTYSKKSYITTNLYKKVTNGYEVRGVKFIIATPDNEPDSFRLSWIDKNGDSHDEIKIDKVAWLGDVLANGCRLSKHYDWIKIADQKYNDVIKIECISRAEAYYQKDYGLIAQNILLPRGGDAKILSQEDLVGRNLMNVDPLYSRYHLSGKNVKIAVIDGGFVENTHVEFDKRVEWIKNGEDNLSISDHATHVAGIIGAKGLDHDAIGVATDAKLYSYSFFQYDYIRDIFEDLNKQGILLSNNSYGPQTGKTYDFISQSSDFFVYKHPYSIIVNSAGNSRDNGEGYWNIKDFSSAKNIITVGAIDQNKKITSFSSVGPVNSGRIKPDIVAFGLRVRSTVGDDYKYMSGTSMSAPHITGLLALLQEQYQRANKTCLREDTAKAILANSALDLGRKGPDYEYGYGLPDALKAANMIDSMQRADSHIILNEVSEGNSKEFTLHVPKEQNVKLTLSWIDPSNDAKYLNDTIVPTLNTLFDFKLIDENENVYYPWSLNDDNPTALARNDRVNHIDNLQQIEAHLKRGNYKVVIENIKMDIGSNQNFTLVSNLPLSRMSIGTKELKRIEFGYFLMNLY